MIQKMKSVAVVMILSFGVAAGAVTAHASDSGASTDSAQPDLPKTIVEAALAANAKDGSFSYLIAAATCPQLNGAIVAALSGDTALTLFAPTDDAFKQLQTALGLTPPTPAKTCSLDAATLAEVLTYHVTLGSRTITGLGSVFNSFSPIQVPMLSGNAIVTNPDLTMHDLHGQAIGIVPGAVNILTRNGVIHAIDTVLLPF